MSDGTKKRIAGQGFNSEVVGDLLAYFLGNLYHVTSTVPKPLSLERDSKTTLALEADSQAWELDSQKLTDEEIRERVEMEQIGKCLAAEA